jgi:hypothetical protein
MAVTVFLDTSVLLAGLVDFGPQSAPAQQVLHAVAEKRVSAASNSIRWRRGYPLNFGSRRGMPRACSRRRCLRA